MLPIVSFCLFPLCVDTLGNKTMFAHITLLSPFLSTCSSPLVRSSSTLLLSSLFFHPPCVLFGSVTSRVTFLLCPLVADIALPSTSFSLCSRPTTGPPSVFVFPTFTLNSSCLSTTSWSGTVQHLITFPQHIHLTHPFPCNMLVFIYWHWYRVNWLEYAELLFFSFFLYFILIMNLLGGSVGQHL